MESGLDSVRWLFIGTAVVTLAVNPVFGLMVSRVPRLFFISATYLFFAVSLLVFYGLLTLAPDIQEQLLFLPSVEQGRNTTADRQLRPIVATSCWKIQRQMWLRHLSNTR